MKEAKDRYRDWIERRRVRPKQRPRGIEFKLGVCLLVQDLRSKSRNLSGHGL